MGLCGPHAAGWRPVHSTASVVSKLQSQHPTIHLAAGVPLFPPAPHKALAKDPQLPSPRLPARPRPEQLAAANQHLQPGCSSDKLDRAAKAAGIAQRRQTQHPPTLQMVKEALRAQDEKKGASVFAIKRFILAKYPTVDPIRLKYLLKQALSKGLSCGDLVRPHNSSAVGATGTFKLAPKKLQHKQQLAQTDPDRGQAPKPGQKGTTKVPRAPVAGAQQQGAVKQQPTAVKQKLKAKPVDAQPRVVEKPRSNKAKPPQAADRPRAHGTGASGPLRAASHPQAPGKGRPGPRAALAAEKAGQDESDGSASAGVKGPRKAPREKTKGRVPKRAQQDAPKAQGGQDQARKPRVTPGAGQGKARLQKAAPGAADGKDP